MKKLITILLLTSLLSSCLYTKESAIKKFCKQDSIPYSIIVHDTFVIQSIKVDTMFNASVDTLTIIKDRLVIRYKKVGEKIFIQGKCKGDTIYKTKFVNVQVPINIPKTPWYQELWYVWLIVIAMLLLVIWIGKK